MVALESSGSDEEDAKSASDEKVGLKSSPGRIIVDITRTGAGQQLTAKRLRYYVQYSKCNTVQSRVSWFSFEESSNRGH